MTNKEAIEILNGIEQLWGNFPEDGDLVEEALQMAIKALEQEPKTGHWIGDKCSVCREERAWYGYNPLYCPDCGARMEVEE